MNADTRAHRFPERTIRQVRLDGDRAMMRARFHPDQFEVMHLRCVDDQPESELQYGHQLWYFEGHGLDDRGTRLNVFGVIEYSVQFGLHELVEDGVFDAEPERTRFRQLYERDLHPPSWGQPAHRWLTAGLFMVASVWIGYLLLRTFAA